MVPFMRRSIFLGLLSLPLWLAAQHQLSLHLLPQTYQSTLTNPAFQQDAKVQVVQPLLGTSFTLAGYHSGFVLNDLLEDPDATPLRIDPDQAIDALQDQNYVEARFSAMPLAVALQFGDTWQASLHVSNHTLFQIGYGRTLPSLLWRGNGPTIGDTVDVGVGFDLTNYSEIGLGLSKQLSDKLTVGGRLKLLNGTFNFSSDPRASSLSLYTNPEFYQLTVSSDYRVRASAPGIDNFNAFFDGDSLGTAPQAGDLFDFANFGFAIDLGVQFQPIERLTLNASAINLGSIGWNEPAEVRASQGSVTFAGFDPFSDQFQSGDSASFEQIVEESLGAFADSVQAKFDFAAEEDGYRTSLPTRFFLSGSYQLFRFLSVGGAYTGEAYRGAFHQMVAVNASFTPAHWFTLGAQYAYDTRYRGMLGLQYRLNLKSLQFYGGTSNVLAPFTLGTLRAANLVFGMNLTFGRRAYQEEARPQD